MISRISVIVLAFVALVALAASLQGRQPAGPKPQASPSPGRSSMPRSRRSQA